MEVDRHQRMEPQPIRLDQHAEGRKQRPAEGQRGRTPVRRLHRRQRVRGALRLRGRHSHLPGHQDRARHPVQGAVEARQSQQHVPRQDAGHDRHARPRAARRNDPHQRQRARRQAQREVHHHRHQGHERQQPPPREPVGDVRGHLPDPRRPGHDPLHVQEHRRQAARLRQRARRHRVRQGVQALLRQERGRRDRQRALRRDRRHRQAGQSRYHGNPAPRIRRRRGGIRRQRPAEAARQQRLRP